MAIELQELNQMLNDAQESTLKALDLLRQSAPRDASVIWECAQVGIKEYSFLVECAIVEGASGNVDQAVLYHKLSYQCLQVIGGLMEKARGEGPMEHYLSARESK